MTTEPEPPAKTLILGALGLASWVVLWAIPVAIVGDMWLRQTPHSGSSIWIWMAASAWAMPRAMKMIMAHWILTGVVLVGWAAAMLRFGTESDHNGAWTTLCVALAAPAIGLLAWLWDKNASPEVKGTTRVVVITTLIAITFFSAVAFAGLLLKDVNWRKALTEDWYMTLLILYLPMMGLGWWLWSLRKTGKVNHDSK